MEIKPGHLPMVEIVSNVPVRMDSSPAVLQYIGNIYNSMGGTNWVIGQFNTKTFNRRRNPATNQTVYNLDLPDVEIRPTIDNSVMGTRDHFDPAVKLPTKTYLNVSGTRYIAPTVIDQAAIWVEDAEKVLLFTQYQYLKPGFPGIPPVSFSNQLLTKMLAVIYTKIRASVFNVPIEVSYYNDKTISLPHDQYRDGEIGLLDRLMNPSIITR